MESGQRRAHRRRLQAKRIALLQHDTSSQFQAGRGIGAKASSPLPAHTWTVLAFLQVIDGGAWIGRRKASTHDAQVVVDIC
jgi:hypothetical protein